MYRFIRILQRIANILPAVTLIEVTAGRPEMQRLIPGLGGILDNMLLQQPRQPFASRRVINIQGSQPGAKILSGDQIAAPKPHGAHKLFVLYGNKGQR